MTNNTLHTVNRWNKQSFLGNVFDGVTGNSQMQIGKGLFNYNLSTPTVLTAPKVDWSNPVQRAAALGTTRGMVENFGKEADATNAFGKIASGKQSGLSSFFSNNSNGLLSAAGNAVGGLGYSLLSNGYSTGVGSGLQSIGSTVGGLVGVGNPLLGGILTAGSGIIGGGINALWGEKVDEKKLNEAIAGTNYLNNFTSSADNFNDLESIQGQASVGDVYSGGIFNSSADRKNEKLRAERAAALGWAERSLSNNISNIWNDKLNNSLGNYASKGGLLRRYADGGELESAFLDSFSSDPIGAAVRYNDGLERMAAEREAREAEAAREAEYTAMQQRLANLETQNQGLQALMSAMPTRTLNTAISTEPLSPTPSIATPESGNLSNFIRSHEGFRSNAYQLAGESTPTIGYGFHTVYPGTNRLVKMGDKISRKEADSYLNTAITNIGNELSRKVPNWNKMTSFQRDALIDLAYGTGTGGKHFRKNSKLMTALRNEDWDEAERQLVSRSASLPEYNKYLLEISKRRQDMFREGKYSMKAFGGELGTNGTDFSNGLLEINEGGSHQENPFGGVQLGLDERGIPNLVEEGETVYNDYVFSNRLKVPAFMGRELGLGGSLGKKGLTFAQASKKLAQESAQRPNDPISIAGLEASLSRLAEVQEAERMRNQVEENNEAGVDNKFAGGGWVPYAYDSDITKFKYWDKDRNDYDEGYKNFINNLDASWINQVMSGKYGDMSRYKKKNAGAPTVEDARTLGLDRKYSDWHKAMAAAYDDYQKGYTPDISSLTAGVAPAPLSAIPDLKAAPTLRSVKPTVPAENKVTVGDMPPIYPTWMRYAPAWGTGVISLTDALGITNRPDYTYADRLEAAASRAGYAPSVKAHLIGNYLNYKPMDIWFGLNRMDANARATDRSIMNAASGNTGAAMAGLLANSYNNQIADGQLYRQALEYNDAQRKAVADFNRRTDMFNSQMGLEAAMANARYRQQATQFGLSGLGQAAALRDSIDARTGASRSANLTNFLTSLGNIGRENFALNQINTDRSRRYTTDNRGVSGYKRSASFGGKIKKQK